MAPHFARARALVLLAASFCARGVATPQWYVAMATYHIKRKWARAKGGRKATGPYMQKGLAAGPTKQVQHA